MCSHSGIYRYRRAAVLVFILTMVAAPGLAQPASQDTAEIERRGRALTRQFLAGSADSLVGELSDSFVQQKGGREGVRSWVREEREWLGGPDVPAEAARSPGQIVEERAYLTGGEAYYCQVRNLPGDSTTLDERKVLRWRWGTTETKAVTGAFMNTATTADLPQKSQKESTTVLRLPVEGRWYVNWGGDHACENYHVSYGQSFAYDLTVRQNGRAYHGDGTENSDYYCYGRSVVAPASGRVVVARDTIPDNETPFSIDNRLSNQVALAHGSGEYSILTHLRPNSVTVEVGERVERGQKIGECGNSGSSQFPHLDYSLVTDPDPREGKGLPAPFVDYEANGELIERGTPVRGEYESPQ